MSSPANWLFPLAETTIFQDIVSEKQTRMYVACAAFNPSLSVIQKHSCFYFFSFSFIFFLHNNFLRPKETCIGKTEHSRKRCNVGIQIPCIFLSGCNSPGRNNWHLMICNKYSLRVNKLPGTKLPMSCLIESPPARLVSSMYSEDSLHWMWLILNHLHSGSYIFWVNLL